MLKLFGKPPRSLSITSWFCVPEQGMKDLEVLCRSSAFLIKAQRKEFSHKYHLLTVSHTVAPWRWPKYYPDEWLKFVNEDHTYHTTELRYDDGIFVTQNELEDESFHHPKRDLAIMHLQNEEKVLERLFEYGLPGDYTIKSSQESQLLQGTKLVFHGHEITGGDGFDSDNRLPVPATVGGTVSARTAHQTFVETESTVLLDGMCGGPVVLNDSIDSAGDSKAVVGLVEGIVPVDHDIEGIRGHAVFVEGDEILQFLDEIEQGKVEPLKGGKVKETVGKDQDSDKMDLSKFL